MVSADKLSVFFGGFTLFNDVSFLINKRDRIGLVGKNGAGKTTLLKLLTGAMQPTSGSITGPKDITIGHLPQHLHYNDDETVMKEALKAFAHLQEIKNEADYLNNQLAERTDYESDAYMELIEKASHASERFALLGGNDFTGETEKVLLGLGFTRDDLQRPTKEFSGGWRMRIELAKVLLQKPDLLLLDEPTNHLDIESIQWLENFLINYFGAVVLVSHDKAFLDNITTRTIEISLGKIYDYKSNYSKYLVLRAERREQQLRAYENQQKMIKDTEDFIERFRYKATKAVQVQSRIKHLEKIDRIEVDEEDNSRLRLKFPPAPRAGSIILEAENYSVGYGDFMVLKDVDLMIENGEKVAFVGKNGEGKSTLIKAIMNQLEGSGKWKPGHNVLPGYFAQNQAEQLNGELTVFDTIDHVAVGDIRTKIRDILGAFMFGGEEADKKVKVLSGGERSRLAMIKLLLEPVNFLVLDEPTNHLDIRSKEILKQAIKEFDGTAVVVSHDRDFLEGLVDKVYEFGGGKIKEHLGGIYDFLRSKNVENLRELERRTPLTEAAPKQKTASKESFQERKALNREIKKAEKELEQCEKRVAKLENEQAGLNKKLANPDNAMDHDLYKRFREVEIMLEKEMEKWEKAQENLDKISSQLN